MAKKRGKGRGKGKGQQQQQQSRNKNQKGNAAPNKQPGALGDAGVLEQLRIYFREHPNVIDISNKVQNKDVDPIRQYLNGKNFAVSVKRIVKTIAANRDVLIAATTSKAADDDKAAASADATGAPNAKPAAVKDSGADSPRTHKAKVAAKEVGATAAKVAATTIVAKEQAKEAGQAAAKVAAVTTHSKELAKEAGQAAAKAATTTIVAKEHAKEAAQEAAKVAAVISEAKEHAKEVGQVAAKVAAVTTQAKETAKEVGQEAAKVAAVITEAKEHAKEVGKIAAKVAAVTTEAKQHAKEVAKVAAKAAVVQRKAKDHAKEAGHEAAKVAAVTLKAKEDAKLVGQTVAKIAATSLAAKENAKQAGQLAAKVAAQTTQAKENAKKVGATAAKVAAISATAKQNARAVGATAAKVAAITSKAKENAKKVGAQAARRASATFGGDAGGQEYYTNDSEESSEDINDVPDFNAQNDYDIGSLVERRAASMGLRGSDLTLRSPGAAGFGGLAPTSIKMEDDPRVGDEVFLLDEEGNAVQLGAVVKINRDGTFDVFVQELHRRFRNVPRDHVRILPDESESDSITNDEADSENSLDSDQDELPVTRKECVFWLLLACYQVMSELRAREPQRAVAAQYRHMKRRVVSHDEVLLSLARDAHISEQHSRAALDALRRLFEDGLGDWD